MDKRSALLTLARRAPEDMRRTLSGLQAILLQPAVAPDWPRHLQVEIVTYCNRHCSMCPRTVALARASSPAAVAEWRRFMPVARFLALLDNLPDLETASLHGIGEPLLHRGPLVGQDRVVDGVAHVAIRQPDVSPEDALTLGTQALDGAL